MIKLGGPLKINLYSIQRNEAKILPFWLQYYRPIADRIIVYDDQSDDGSRVLLEAAGAEVRDYPSTLLDDGVMAALYSSCYKEDQKADWAILVDADEFIWGNGLIPFLEWALKAGYHVLEPMGQEMWSESFPVYDPLNIIRQKSMGEPASWWTNNGFKPCVLRPQAKGIGLGCGRHTRHGMIEYKALRREEFKLLHYRNFGYEYYLWHHQRNADRLSPHRSDLTWGQHNFAPLSEKEFLAGCHSPQVRNILDDHSPLLYASERM